MELQDHYMIVQHNDNHIRLKQYVLTVFFMAGLFLFFFHEERCFQCKKTIPVVNWNINVGKITGCQVCEGTGRLTAARFVKTCLKRIWYEILE